MEHCVIHTLICMTDTTMIQVSHPLLSDHYQWVRWGHFLNQTSNHSQVFTCVGKRSRASDTLWRNGRPFPFPMSPFTMTPPPPPPSLTPPPPPPSESDEGESWPEASFSISLTQGGLRSMWKSAEILQLLETSKRARLMKKGSTWGSAHRRLGALHTWTHQTGFKISLDSVTVHHISC